MAVLSPSDADHIPAVEWVRIAGGFKVINATWSRHGFDLAKTAWANLPVVDDVMGVLKR